MVVVATIGFVDEGIVHFPGIRLHGDGGIEGDGAFGLFDQPGVGHAGEHEVVIAGIVEAAPDLFAGLCGFGRVLPACGYEGHFFRQVEFLPAVPILGTKIDFGFAAEIDDGSAVRIPGGDFGVVGKGFQAVGKVVLADQHEKGVPAIDAEPLWIGQIVARLLAEKGIELEAGIEVGIFDIDTGEGAGIADFVAVNSALGFLHGIEHHQAAGGGVVVGEAGEAGVVVGAVLKLEADGAGGELEAKPGFVESPRNFVGAAVVVEHDAPVDLLQPAVFIRIVQVAAVDHDGDGVAVGVEKGFAPERALGDELEAADFAFGSCCVRYLGLDGFGAEKRECQKNGERYG